MLKNITPEVDFDLSCDNDMCDGYCDRYNNNKKGYQNDDTKEHNTRG